MCWWEAAPLRAKGSSHVRSVPGEHRMVLLWLYRPWRCASRAIRAMPNATRRQAFVINGHLWGVALHVVAGIAAVANQQQVAAVRVVLLAHLASERPLVVVVACAAAIVAVVVGCFIACALSSQRDVGLGAVVLSDPANCAPAGWACRRNRQPRLDAQSTKVAVPAAIHCGSLARMNFAQAHHAGFHFIAAHVHEVRAPPAFHLVVHST